jgi:hypothetical protein
VKEVAAAGLTGMCRGGGFADVSPVAALQLGSGHYVQTLSQSMLMIQRHPRLTHEMNGTAPAVHMSQDSWASPSVQHPHTQHRLPKNTVQDMFSRSCRQMQPTQQKLNALAASAFLRTKSTVINTQQ